MATNMKIGGGGAYFIISRSLGLEAGAAIGLPLFFAQSLGIAFYIAGFTEAIVGNLGACLPVWLTAKVIAVATLSFLTFLAYVSADLALKAQFLILATILASLGSYFLGGSVSEVAGGVPVPPGTGFWPVFAVFFPAVTGIEAGLAMSGDLKNPEKALPLGTLGAVATGYFVYMALPILLSQRIPEADMLLNPNALRAVARWGVLIVAGVFAASLSSALGALLGAPRTLQALANDRIIPSFIGRGYGKDTDNIGLMLTLAYQIQKSPVWNQSKLVIKTIVASEKEREGAETRFETFIEEQRIPAETEVMIQNGVSTYDMIRTSSSEAGLVFMGMRPPGVDENAGDYARYYGTLMETTRGLPPLALMLAAEAIEFRKVIGLSELN